MARHNDDNDGSEAFMIYDSRLTCW
jgi:hypothetical protein